MKERRRLRRRGKNGSAMNTPWHNNQLIPKNLDFITKVQEPFLYSFPNGSTVLYNNNESVCITDVALSAIDSFLCQKKKNNEFSKAAALVRTQNSKKRKRTPNTTRGDDGIGILNK